MHWAEPVAFDFESKITHKKKHPIAVQRNANSLLTLC